MNLVEYVKIKTGDHVKIKKNLTVEDMIKHNTHTYYLTEKAAEELKKEIHKVTEILPEYKLLRLHEQPYWWPRELFSPVF